MNNQNNFLNRTRQLVRRCSFCRNEGHNISQCNDITLQNFYSLLIDRRNELREIHSIDLDNKIAYFETWLHGQDIHLVKSFAMRFCGAYARNNIQLCVQKIIQMVWNVETNVYGLLSQIDEITEDYIPLPSRTVMSIMDVEIEEFNLVDYLVDIRNNNEEPNENRKFQIKPILCLDTEELDVEEDCNICFEKTQFRNMITLNCKHKFCGDCVSQTFKKCNKNKVPNCAMCRAKTDWFLVNDNKVLQKLKENIV